MIEHFQQSNPSGSNSCIPACAQMVLKSLEIEISEAKLCEVLETDELGTELALFADLIGKLSIPCNLEWRRSDIGLLEATVKTGKKPVVVVSPPEQQSGLWLHTANHALVVTKLDDTLIWIHDPLRVEGPTKIPTVEFIELWSEAGALEFIIDKIE